ncbi:sigma-E factor negative regulatory protein [Nitrosococcus watsonii]|nr:sigma-E factor negative regulatory protein [Nitrosococcus watsonii]
MNDELNEQLSALMDGELPPEEIKSVLQGFETQEEVRRRWENYHLVRDSLQGHLPEACRYDLARQVSQLLDNEPPLLAEKHRRTDISRQLRQKWRYGAGLALAASLSAVAVLGIQSLASKPLIPQSQIATTLSVPVSSNPAIAPIQENSRHWAVLEPDVKERLNTYLVNHTEYVDMPGMLRYGRIVSYESSR